MVNRAKHKFNALKLFENTFIVILLIIFGGIVLHAPISVGLGALWPNYSLLIKSWKEILMLLAGLMALFLLYKSKQMKILRDPIIIAIAAYGLLHLMLLSFMPQGLTSSLAGLAIDLRYVYFFGLVYVAMRLYPGKRKMFINVGIAGALVVLVFAMLQVFVLPYDVLKYIGYNTHTISPYLTIDKNYNFIRINSTLRGPNPLGAFAVLTLTMVVAAAMKNKIKKQRWPLITSAILSFGGVIALCASYSRSAFIATIVAITIVVFVAGFHKLSTKLWITIGCCCLALAGAFLLISNTQFVSNIFLHINPNGGSSDTSNQAHIRSQSEGLNQLIHQPLGAGIGSTGSASMFSNRPEIIENQFLFIAHEVGWLGLMLFIFILASILARLWELRNDWLALGVFASGIGLLLICILLPIWVDDTISIIWWGLAAIAMFSDNKGYN